MRVLVVGLGLVGQELACQLRADGHEVIGTTTTPAKVESLTSLVDQIAVLRGSDRSAIQHAAAGCHAIAVCAGPVAARAMTPEDRAATYHEVLVETASSVAAAGCTGPVVALSSLSVYGDAADGEEEVTESSPVTAAQDPSPRNFLAMESTYLSGLPDTACVLRCADIFGNDDPPIAAKVRLAHTVLGGSVPFSADALFYRIDVRDVAAAIRHAITTPLVGVFNLTHVERPPSNRDCFDAIGSAQGLGPLTYRGEIKAPARPVSTAKLTGTGFAAVHTRAEPVAAGG